MSTLKVDSIKNTVNIPSGVPTIGGNSITQQYTSSATEPTNPSAGDMWWDSGNSKFYRYINSVWKEITVVFPA